MEIARISTGKGNTFTIFCCHIQGIVPVSSAKTVNIMNTYIIKSGKLLDQNVLQNTSGIYLTVFGALFISICVIPESINFCAAHGLCIFKIRNLFLKDLYISGLINIKTGRD